jgi:short subunit dehydrogenase-like uncharacterized protein
MTKEFDIVVHGATGFTGRLIAEYLLTRTDTGLKWAMGGRSLEKLQAVRDEIGAPASTPLVVIESSDETSLKSLMAKTRLVISAVGPYQLYGNELVKACAESGVDYVDLCGEPAWMRHMIDQHQSAAEKSGSRLVFSCGFDSSPFDLGVFMAQDEMTKRFGKPASRVRGRVRKMKATMAAAATQPGVIDLLKNPFSLTPGFEGPKQPTGHKPMLDDVMGVWVAPFIMATINTRNVHRSNFLLSHLWGADFVYDEMVVTGPGEKGEAIANAIAQDKSMSEDKLKPGEGPSKAEREAGSYDLLFLATNEQGESVKVGVKGDRDPGYGSTSKMIAEAAICLLKDASATKGGFWTPASAMGHALIARLQSHAGLTFQVE